MTLNELVRLWRLDVDDAVEPYLWADDEAFDFANDAQQEAARRARLLIDSTTPEVARIAVVAGQESYALDPRVLFIRRVRFAGRLALHRMNLQDMEAFNPYWEDAAPGEPRFFIPDADTGMLRFWPTPAYDDTALLTVVRDPLADMDSDDDVPEINARYHRSLRHWMSFRGYSKQDSQANDPKKAADALALFEQEFGKKSSAIDEVWITREQLDFDGTF
jgi:hypothetical protein